MNRQREAELAEHRRADDFKAAMALLFIVAVLALFIWFLVAVPDAWVFFVFPAFSVVAMLAIWGIWAFFQWLFSDY